MTVKSSKSAGDSAMSAALERIRPMLVAIGGPRSWDDTKDHWRNRLARKVGINARRVRAILSGEKIRLSADEYINIESRFVALDARIAAAHEAMAPHAGEVCHANIGQSRKSGIAWPMEQSRASTQQSAPDVRPEHQPGG